MKNIIFFKSILGFCLAFLLTSCDGSIFSKREQIKEEVERNIFTKDIIDPIYITGRALYEFVDINKENRDYSKVLEEKPVAFAHAHVLDSRGKLVQGVFTDSDGYFQMALPKTETTHYLYVYAWMQAGKFSTCVSDNVNGNIGSEGCYELEGVHYIKKAIRLNEDKDIGTILATNDSGSKNAGAFHIADKMRQGVAWVRDEMNVDTSDFPPLKVFWDYGFSLGSENGYIGGEGSIYSSDNLIYLRGGALNRKGLIEEGSDPDHFDSAIILHEFGHYIEHTFGKSSSPGDTHTLGQNFDPRIAWSEGFCHFLQAAILEDPDYVDSNHLKESHGGLHFNIETCNKDDLPCIETLLEDGEGAFRELQVSRYLFDLLDDSPGEKSDKMHVEPGAIWSVYTSDTEGFRQEEVAFVDVGLFNYFLKKLIGSTKELSDLRYSHKIPEEREVFAQRLTTSNNCSPFVIEPFPPVDSDGAFNPYDWTRNNKYYHFYQKDRKDNTIAIRYGLYNEDDEHTPDFEVNFFKHDRAPILEYVDNNRERGFRGIFPHTQIRILQPINVALEDEDSGEAELTLDQNARTHWLINIRALEKGARMKFRLFNGEDVLCPDVY